MMGRSRANPCYRVYSVLRDAREQDDTISTLAAWSNAFGVSETEHLDGRYDTLYMLRLLDKQAKLAQLQAKENLDLASDAIEATFQRISLAMEVTAIGQTWDKRKIYITDNLLRTLKVYSRGLPEDPETANEYELQQVQRDLEEFAKQVEEKVEDGNLRCFLLEQITTIRRALLEYYVVGVAAFRSASGSFVAELQDPHNQKIYEEHKDSPWLKKLGELWGRSLKLYGTYKALDDVGAIQAIESGFDAAKDLIS